MAVTEEYAFASPGLSLDGKTDTRPCLRVRAGPAGRAVDAPEIEARFRAQGPFGTPENQGRRTGDQQQETPDTDPAYATAERMPRVARGSPNPFASSLKQVL